MTVGNGSPAQEQIGMELLRDEGEAYDDMGNPRIPALRCRHGQLPGVVFGTVINAQRGDHLVLRERLIQCRDGIQSAA